MSDRQRLALALYERKVRRARTSLLEYTELTKPDFETAAHHGRIAGALERVASGECRRLIITAPPRHTKSELASRRFPAWYLGRFPNRQVIATAYGSQLVEDFSRDVRGCMNEPEHRAVFPKSALSRDTSAAHRWTTEASGIYVASGVGGAITGRGAHLMLIDDPFKTREEADSPEHRRKVWGWYQSVAYPRLMPGGAIVLIGTRWHEDDMHGRLLEAADNGGDPWELLHLPAIDDFGRALWPQWYSLEDLERIRANISPREWQAQYLGDPTPDEGAMFKREWLEHDYETLPAGLRYYGASDYATKHGEGDWTVHMVAGVDKDDEIYVVDLWRQRTTSDAWIESLLDLMERYRPVLWAEEAGQIEKSVGPFIFQRQRERRIWCRREAFSSAADKAARARAIEGRFAMGMVHFPRNRAWVAPLKDEIIKFPAGKHDDQVDCLSLLGRILPAMRGRRPKKAESPPPLVEGTMQTMTYGDLVAREHARRSDRRRRGRIHA